MNIFVMILVFLFMAGYYFLDAPSQKIPETELEYAIKKSDLRSVAECLIGVHTAAVKNYKFDDVCAQQYEIITSYICLGEKKEIIKCDGVGRRRPTFKFIVTSTGNLEPKDYNSMISIFEKNYQNIGTFGLFIDAFILSGGMYGKHAIANSIIKQANLSNGQLVYITQSDVTDPEKTFEQSNAPEINCSIGTIKAYRFGRWQCIADNLKTACNGDNIWDSDLMECIQDDSRKPLCGNKQTAVMVDDLWECIDPFSEKSCPVGTTAKLNYTNLEWECIENPSADSTVKKCSGTKRMAIYGTVGSTLRITSNNCTDCEKMVTDSETCATKCVPDPAKISDSKCYSTATQCSGASRAFYFGFPNSDYVANVSAISGYTVPFDIEHSQNRKFNCIDCGTGSIDESKSLSPYIAVCE